MDQEQERSFSSVLINTVLSQGPSLAPAAPWPVSCERAQAISTPRENTWQSVNPSLLELEGVRRAKVIFVVLVISILGVLPWSRGS